MKLPRGSASRRAGSIGQRGKGRCLPFDAVATVASMTATLTAGSMANETSSVPGWGEP
jgi:hypothetical protein